MEWSAEKSISGLKGGFASRVKPATGEKCERCWNSTEDVDIHIYWPAWRVCKRCVQALLEMKIPPFIARTETDFYICKNEQEWWEIRLGRIEVPKAD
jgi:hypothetical protein